MNGKGVNGTRETTGTESQRCTHNGFGTVTYVSSDGDKNPFANLFARDIDEFMLKRWLVFEFDELFVFVLFEFRFCLLLGYQIQNKNVRNSPSTANDVYMYNWWKIRRFYLLQILCQKPRRISTDELSPQRTKLGEPTQSRFEIKSWTHHES